MNDAIQLRKDHIRGCGWRQPGGLYLISGSPEAHCGRLPIPLTVCQTCGQGIRQTRGTTWIDPRTLLLDSTCPCATDTSPDCPLSKLEDLPRSLLMWVGATHYPSTAHFTAEAIRLGISKRIASKPNGLGIGTSRIYLAHPRATIDPETLEQIPGIFMTFVPTAIEYVARGDETPQELANLVKRGITPVKVEYIEPQPHLL